MLYDFELKRGKKEQVEKLCYEDFVQEKEGNTVNISYFLEITSHLLNY